MASKTDYDARVAAENDKKIRASRRKLANKEAAHRMFLENETVQKAAYNRRDAKLKKANLKSGWEGLADKVTARKMGEQAYGGPYPRAQALGERLLAEARRDEKYNKKRAMDWGEGYGDRGANPTGMRTGGGYKEGGAVITEKKTGETYKSKAAMKKHEAGETKSEQKAEMKKGYMKGGAAISGKRGKNMVAVSGPKVPNAVKAGSAKLGKK